MKKLKDNIETISIENIVPDANQPRKYFDPQKIRFLKESIIKYGIMNPLTVEKVGTKYLLIDGERRFRAATEAKLTEVPAIVIAPQSSLDRLIQQFHMQEQHEGWTATEKAVTVNELSKELKIPIVQLAEMLGISKDSVTRYVAFSSLLEKKEYQKNELSIHWAVPMASVKSTAKKLYNNVLEKPFTQDIERGIEKAIIQQIKNGDVKRSGDLGKLKDSFVKSPKDIERFIDKGITVEALFIETKAKSAYHLRAVVNGCGYLTTNINKFLSNPDVVPTSIDKTAIKMARTAIDNLYKKIED